MRIQKTYSLNQFQEDEGFDRVRESLRVMPSFGELSCLADALLQPSDNRYHPKYILGKKPINYSDMNVLNKIYDSRLGRTRQIDRGRRRVRDGRYSAARKVKDAVDYEYLTAYARQMANDIINGYIDAEMPFDRSARDLAMDLFEIECDNGDMSEEELDAYDEITAEVAYEVLNDPATSRMIDEHNASLSDGIEDSRRPSRLRSSRVRDGRLASRSRYLRVGR